MTDIAEVLEAVTVRPGDTLIICVGPSVNAAELEEFRAQGARVLGELAPDVEFAVAVAEQVAGVWRAEDADV